MEKTTTSTKKDCRIYHKIFFKGVLHVSGFWRDDQVEAFFKYWKKTIDHNFLQNAEITKIEYIARHE